MPDAYFDFELFRKHVALAQRIMDDIIDLELEKIEQIMHKIDSDPESDEVKYTERHLWEKIYKKSGMGRRTGVGITAEGDMLAALGLRYGTEEATDFSELVHKTIALSAYRSSVDMARERGAFAIYDTEREKNNPFIARLREADANLYADMAKYGRRNIACLTIAPTGTTSLMSQTTSGIEPVFLPVYKRRRKVNPNDTNVHVDFTDETGDAYEEYIVFHPKFVTWMEAQGYNPAKQYSQDEIDALVQQSPYYKATSNDVDWLMKVKMQGRIQKWVDHSISVTINLAVRCRREPRQPTLRGSLAFGLQGMHRLPGRFACRGARGRIEGQERRVAPLQAAYDSRDTPQGAGGRRGAFPEQQGEVGGLRRPAQRLSLRNLHGRARRRRRHSPAQERHDGTHHQELR